MGSDEKAQAADLKAALGGVKGPIMKVAQMLASIPRMRCLRVLLPNLRRCKPTRRRWAGRSSSRRMSVELGPAWEARFKSLRTRSVRRSLARPSGHRATSKSGEALALQAAISGHAAAVGRADLAQLKLIFSIYRRMDRAIDPSEMADEIGDRLREELDYEREGGAYPALSPSRSRSDRRVTCHKVIDALSPGAC